MIRRSTLLLVAMLASAAPAAAQQQVFIQPRVAVPPESQGNVRVSVSMTLFAPASLSDLQAAGKAQENARRILYESAGRECELLRAVIASECRLEGININVNRTYGNQQPEGFNASGSFSFHIKLK